MLFRSRPVADAVDEQPAVDLAVRDGQRGRVHVIGQVARGVVVGVEVDDLAAATHDPLLAALRQRLRREHGAARQGPLHVRCVFSREPVALPNGACTVVDAGLNCHGYGSSVTVTASFGMATAGEAIAQCLAPAVPPAAAVRQGRPIQSAAP